MSEQTVITGEDKKKRRQLRFSRQMLLVLLTSVVIVLIIVGVGVAIKHRKSTTKPSYTSTVKDYSANPTIDSELENLWINNRNDQANNLIASQLKTANKQQKGHIYELEASHALNMPNAAQALSYAKLAEAAYPTPYSIGLEGDAQAALHNNSAAITDYQQAIMRLQKTSQALDIQDYQAKIKALGNA